MAEDIATVSVKERNVRARGGRRGRRPRGRRRWPGGFGRRGPWDPWGGWETERDPGNLPVCKPAGVPWDMPRVPFGGFFLGGRRPFGDRAILEWRVQGFERGICIRVTSRYKALGNNCTFLSKNRALWGKICIGSYIEMKNKSYNDTKR